MRNCFISILCTAVVSLFFAGNVMASGITADDLVYLTEEYPPQNFTKDGKVVGVSVEILELMWKSMGSKKTAADIKIVPWARGYNDVLKKDNVVLFGMGYSDERARILSWIGPYFSHSLVLMAKKDSGIQISSIDDAKKYTVGVAREDIGHHIIQKKGFDDSVLDKSSNQSSLLKKLAAGRVDMICYMEDAALKNMPKEGLNIDDYETVYEVLNLRSGYGFNKKIPKSLVDQFQATLDKLVADGSVDKILRKYEIK